MTVLIIDDSLEDRAAVRAFLTEAACNERLRLRFREAETGADGLAEYEQEVPHCILLDQALPDMDGLQVLMCLRRGLPVVPVPVVMLTGSTDASLTAAALRAGAQEYLPKQFMGPEMLLRAVRSARDRFDLIAERQRAEAELHDERAHRRASDIRLSELVESAPGALFQARLTAKKWRNIYISPSISGLTGYKPSQYLGQALSKFTDPDASDGTGWAVAIEQALTDGSSAFDVQVWHIDGHRLWVRANLKLDRADIHQPLITGYVVDITRERAMDEALRAAERDTEEAVMAGPGCFYRMQLHPDRPLCVDYVSGGVERVYGYTREETKQTGWFRSILDPAHAAIIEDQHQRLLRLEPTISEYRIRSKSGQWVWISSTVNPRRQTETDGSVWAVGYATDITAAKERSAQVQQASRLALLGEMATGMAHELRQPLTTISLAAQNAAIALDDGKFDSVRMRLGRIIEQTDRASAIIEHLRLFGRGSDPEAAAVPVSLEAVLEGSLGLIGATLKLDLIGVTSALGQPGLWVLGDQTRLEQVLVNLFVNARDALIVHRANDGTRHIHIAAELTGGVVSLTVADNGGGIPVVLLPQMFQPFVTTKLADKGIGLGLSICHGLISKMGGKIYARNDREGAVFSIELPSAV